MTSGDVASVYIVMANAVAYGGESLPTLFLVDDDLDGIEVVDDPPFHNYPDGHPTIAFPTSRCRGGRGQ